MERGGSAAPGETADTDAWACDALEVLAGVPGVARVGLALSEGGGRQHRFTSDDRGTDGGLDWCPIDAYDDVPLNEVVRTGEPVFGSREELAGRFPDFGERQQRTPYVAFAVLPLCAGGQVLGGAVLYFATPQRFPESQRTELRGLGERLGQQLRRAQPADGRTWASLREEPVPDGARVAVRAVPPDLSAVADVRQEVTRTLEGWDLDDDIVATAVLCLSELVTNALIHTTGGAELRVLLDDGVLTGSVRDGGGHGPLAAETSDDPLRARGPGLQIVGTLADRWGSRLDSAGATVWFVLET